MQATDVHLDPHVLAPTEDERNRLTASWLEAARLEPGLDARRRLEDDVIILNAEVARQEARRYQHRGVELDDLEQVALTALVLAVRRYRPARGATLLSYAVPTIRGELRRHLRDHGWTVRPPRRIQELCAALPRIEEDLVRELGRTPGDGEVAAKLGCTVAELAEARHARTRFRLRGAGSSAAGDDPAPAEVDSAVYEEPGFARAEARTMVGPLLHDLPAEDRRLMALRYAEGRSQSDIGRQAGLGQVQVSRRIRAVLARMRRDLAA